MTTRPVKSSFQHSAAVASARISGGPSRLAGASGCRRPCPTGRCSGTTAGPREVCAGAAEVAAVTQRPRPWLQLVREQDGLGHLAHRLARIHRQLLDFAKRLSLFQALAIHQQALCALDQLAGLEGLAHVLELCLDGLKL